MTPSVRDAIERVFRMEHGRVVASLIRLFGDFDVAEEAVQEAYASALDHWARQGVPASPAAWITTAAKRKAIDRARRERARDAKYSTLLHAAWSRGEVGAPEQAHDSPVEDDRLRLIFTCCHPALNLEAQVALTLRLLGGLSAGEIARAFLVSEEALRQRVVRAKRKIREARIPYSVPAGHALPERLEAVLAVIYLIFNEGYAASGGVDAIRRDLCNEAIRLGRTLTELMPNEPEALGLLALMRLHGARQEARLTPAGEPVLLAEQDRSLWDPEAIAEGIDLVERALRLGRAGPYRVQAAIAAVHAQAATPDQTDWRQIVGLYDVLVTLDPSPVVALNRAAAVAMADGPEHGLALMNRPEVYGPLEQYRWLHSARGELLRRLGRSAEAIGAYRRALELAENGAERAFLSRRLAEVEAGKRGGERPQASASRGGKAAHEGPGHDLDET